MKARRQFLRADGVDRCDDRHVIKREESFGQVAPLYRFKTDDEAIKMANDTPTLPSPARGGRLGKGPPPISTAVTLAASGGSFRSEGSS
jgi:hypothetical protein